MTRAEHLRWAKDRALELSAQGDDAGAYASFLSDLGKHEGTLQARYLHADLGLSLHINGLLKGQKMRDWVEGFS